MLRLRSLLVAVTVVALVTMAAFGIRQMIVGQEPASPLTLSLEARETAEANADADARQAVQDFIDAGGEPCALPRADAIGESVAPYANLASLVNDVDLAIIGRPEVSVLRPPEQHTLAGRLLTTIGVDQLLYGAASADSLTADLGTRAMQSGTDLVRLSALGIDACSSDRLLLFLTFTEENGVYDVSYQGWASLDGDGVTAAEANDLFEAYPDADALIDAVESAYQEQEGLPKGLLLCRQRFTSVELCPGDTFNPYRALKLAATTEAFVITTDPGPGPLVGERIDLPLDDQRLAALLAALDIEVTVHSGTPELEDLIWFTTYSPESVDGLNGFRFDYSPTTGTIWLPWSGGQFAAPAAFVEAMAPFVEAQQQTAE